MKLFFLLALLALLTVISLPDPGMPPPPSFHWDWNWLERDLTPAAVALRQPELPPSTAMPLLIVGALAVAFLAMVCTSTPDA